MKRILAGVMTAALIITMGATSSMAASVGHGHHGGHHSSGKNKVCSHYNASCQFVDKDGDGYCDNCDLKGKYKSGCVDADKDGICDYHYCGSNTHSSKGHGHCR